MAVFFRNLGVIAIIFPKYELKNFLSTMLLLYKRWYHLTDFLKRPGQCWNKSLLTLWWKVGGCFVLQICPNSNKNLKIHPLYGNIVPALIFLLFKTISYFSSIWCIFVRQYKSLLKCQSSVNHCHSSWLNLKP